MRSPTRHPHQLLVITVLAGCAYLAASAAAAQSQDILERVEFADEDKPKQTRTVEGRVLIEAVDGGILLEGRDARLWNVTPDRLRARVATDSVYEPLDATELAFQLKDELGRGFEITRTEHYVICSNAGEDYAKWCGTLFERLWSGFQRQWEQDGFVLKEPAMPLPAIVFANSRQFAGYARRDEGPSLSTAKGYYSIRTNRIVLYDLTAGQRRRRARSVGELNKRLSNAAFNVATIVHEATHQIAFNRGLHTRFADNPLWLTEGMAMYFETPDLNSSDGWRTAGAVSLGRLQAFEKTLRRRKPGAIQALIGTDDRFRHPKLAALAYAESWAFTHFLIKTRREGYVRYLEKLSQKPRLIWDSPEERVAEFKDAFGEDLDELDRSFRAYVELLR